MASTRSVVTLSVAALSLLLVGSMVGCATPETAMERELDMLKREMASLHAGQSKQRGTTPQQTSYYDPYDPYGSRSPGHGTYGANTPGGPPPVPRAPTTAPPPLPVVKLDPLQTNPFSDGREPPIRLGRQGHAAPPVTPGGPMQYDRIDTNGNLLGPGGQVMYRAGNTSDPIDTHPEEEVAYRIYEDPHESPASKVARGTRVPHIPRPGESMAYGQQNRAPGVYGLDDGAPVAMPGHTPGVQPVVQPRVQQFPIESHDLAFDRSHSVRVEQGLSYGQVEPPVNVGYPQQAPPTPAFATPEPQMGAAYGAAPTELPAEFLGGTPIHDTYMEPAQPEPMPAPVPVPAPVAAAKTFPEPVHAPGDNRMIKQKVYKGHKNKLVKSLYKTATTKMKAGDRKTAVRLFKKLLTRYSDHDLSDNALYWLGETAYTQKNWRQALTWFQDVVVRYPEGNKLPDAMLKSALCYAQLGQRDYAVRMLTEVESLFQAAPVAKVARERRLALAGGSGG